MNAPVRALVVDDSVTMRTALSRMLGSDPEIEVVGTAPEPHAARAMIKELDPDVITLDVEMPGMDGLTFLERIMRLRPMPVVMCSSLTGDGATMTIEALRLGAVDCIVKPSGGPGSLMAIRDDLCRTIKRAARSRVRPRMAPPAPAPVRLSKGNDTFRDVVVGIGASTGGVEALFHVVKSLPVDFPPVLIVQHMPAGFTTSFAARLDAESRIKVVEAKHGMKLETGVVHVAPGGLAHMELTGGRGGCISLIQSPPVDGHRPAVERMFRSLVPLADRAVGVILTGMGADGARGLRAMRDAGARTLGQNQESCVVYGMPKAAAEAGAVEREISLANMPEAILAACRA